MGHTKVCCPQVGVKIYFRPGTNPDLTGVPGAQLGIKLRNEREIPVLFARGMTVDSRKHQLRLSDGNGSQADYFQYTVLKVTDVYGRVLWRNVRYCGRCFANSGRFLARNRGKRGRPRYNCQCGNVW